MAEKGVPVRSFDSQLYKRKEARLIIFQTAKVKDILCAALRYHDDDMIEHPKSSKSC